MSHLPHSLVPSPTRARHARARRARTVLAAATLSASLGMNTACYTSHPVMTAPDPGETAVVALNDRGRSALGEAVGPNADRIEGSVVSRSDSAFVLAVQHVQYFGGASNEWKGERVTVPVAGVRDMSQKRYSKARTYLVAGSIAAGLLAFILTRNVFGDGGALIEDPGSGNPPQGSFVPGRP